MPLLRRLVTVTVPAAALLLLAAPAAWAAPGWRWPLPAPHRVLATFAPPPHDWLPGHRGVDLAARPGEAVLAAGAGRVSFAGQVGGIPVVAVRHPDGLETTYEPVRAAVHAGAAVAAGERLGTVAGRLPHCGPHVCLHWGLRRGPAYLDPLSLVGAGGVRLLPMLTRSATGAWVVPAVSGASVGSSAVVVGWAAVATRRRRRRLPDGVACLEAARSAREERVSRGCR